MTTIVISRKHRLIAVDSRNTDSSSAVFLANKIDRLSDGRFFFGSGHLLTIGKAKRWAEARFSEGERPEFGELFTENADDFRFSCLVMSADGSDVTLIDDEMEPCEVLDEFLAIGTGAAYALGALRAGATPETAVTIAIDLDGNSGGPVRTCAF